MNKRIKELAEQAIDYVDSVDDGFGIEHYRELVDQKFAELIVRECMTICEDVAKRNDPAIACYYEIKRTFRS